MEEEHEYETALFEMIENLLGALKRKRWLADSLLSDKVELQRQVDAGNVAIAGHLKDREDAKNKIARHLKDIGDNLSAYNERGIEISVQKKEIARLKDWIEARDITLADLRKRRRRKR